VARVFFMAFDAAGQTTLVKKLRAAGHRLAVTEPRYPQFYELLKQQAPPPEVFVVDCSTMPSHARESSNYVRGLKAYKEIPFVLYNVKKEDEEKTKAKVPGATILLNDKVEPQLAAMGLASSPSPPRSPERLL
jgi:hypothetical protein